MKTIGIALLVALSPWVTLAQSDPAVTVTSGQIRGALLEKGGAVFKGIPYAQPPVGQLRWREPMPVQRWSGVRDAKEFGAMCAQRPSPIVPANVARSEDCLFLNVWTSEWPGRSPKPVMVWIPGGGNFAGGSSSPTFDGERLARRGVVVVTLNYRLGAFGFFSHPALTRESPHHASGNQGILDQIAALKWVKDNIKAFGGDPGNVTIFGESAGSLDVGALMTSSLSKGLFSKVIGESGAVVLVGEPLSVREAEKRGEDKVTRWKTSAGASIETLRAVSVATILDAEPDYTAGGNVATVFPNLGITVDGYMFPRKPAAVFAAGQQHRVALLLGSNAREQVPGSIPPKDLPHAIADAYGPLAARGQALYVGEADPSYGTPAEQWGTDTSFRCGAVQQLIWHARARHTSYEYEFARVPSGREALGSTHASELSHVFGTLDQGVIGRPTSESHGRRLPDLGGDAAVLDELRENGRPKRRQAAEVAAVRRDVTSVHTIHRRRPDCQRRAQTSVLRPVHRECRAVNEAVIENHWFGVSGTRSLTRVAPDGRVWTVSGRW